VTPRQGEIWWGEGRGNRRPVLVVTRSDAIPVLKKLMVAPVTRTVRGIPTEIALDERDGLREPSAASFDNLTLAPVRSLTTRIADTSSARRTEICRALSALADC
jgi:mRNA interferase MazF